MMRHDQQTTIFGIAFWVLFLSSIGLGFVSHYQWLDIAWVLAIDALAAIASVFFVLVRIPAEADHHSWLKPITIPV